MNKVFEFYENNIKGNIIVRRTVIIVIAIALIVIGLIAFINPFSPNLKSIGDKYSGEPFCTIAEDGSYIMIDTNPYNKEDEYFDFDANGAIMEINKELDFPGSVYAQMTSTRAIDGIQKVEHNGMSARWTYHPDKGLEVMYEHA